MTKRMFLAALILGIALAGTASAGGRKDKAELKRVSGTFVSLAIEGATAKWKLNVEEEAGKIKEMTFDMPAAVVVLYSEKNGLRIVHQVRQAGGRVPEGKGKGLIAQGTLLKAEVQGKLLAVAIKSGEGENAGQQDFTMSTRLNVAYQDGQPAVISSIHPEGRGKEKGEGAKPRGNKPEKTPKEAPENF